MADYEHRLHRLEGAKLKYLVIELQTGSDGVVGNIVTSYDALDAAQSHFYSVLAVAVVSTVPIHAAVLMNSYGQVIDTRCFEHPTE